MRATASKTRDAVPKLSETVASQFIFLVFYSNKAVFHRFFEKINVFSFIFFQKQLTLLGLSAIINIETNNKLIFRTMAFYLSGNGIVVFCFMRVSPGSSGFCFLNGLPLSREWIFKTLHKGDRMMSNHHTTRK